MRWAIETFAPRVRSVNPPLGLATLAGLCPDDWEIAIIDENVEPVPLGTDADIVGVCGMGVQFERQKELLAYYRDRGSFVVAGGSYASLCPEKYEALADAVIAGEAEHIWPAFCRDFAAGAPRKLYRESGSVSLDASPPPRFDLLDPSKYAWMTMQFSRGCPFQCEFCDIIVMFGRRPRTKPLEQIGRELDRLRKLNVHNVFFVDDNLIGNPKAAKRLLRYLREYQKSRDYRFRFGTEASLNIADDPELLDLFREARFDWVFVGIESPDQGSLREAKKRQNMRRDILESIREIYRHGIDVTAGFIIGFDNDTIDVFDKQYEFIVEAGIQRAMIGLLVAMEKTPLYERLRCDGRLVPDRITSDNSKLATNVIPKGMTYDQMIAGYKELYYRLQQYPAIARRI
ncbi:MAG: B12-binding domain-containing radical SAM protein, partial [Candidatus Krumholzibacteria bacterium]|nr:B12-binding domain-containing radical SAM protein [Candidatus Krumholzibacteria bacterium]